MPHRLREMLRTMTAEEVARVEGMDDAMKVIFVALLGQPEPPVPPATFQCAHCSMVLTSRISLARHVTALHPEMNKHKCTLCSCTYANRNGLYSHIKKKHQ